MKNRHLCLLLSCLGLGSLTAFAQSTAFQYQGRLNDGDSPASGLYDLRFALFDADSGGFQQGSTVTNAATLVSNGVFTVTLDFGNQFNGANRWVELAVQTNGGPGFVSLTPRQAILPVPYAIYAANAGTATIVSGSVPVGQIVGTLPLAQLPAGVVTNGATGLNLAGAFTGNGVGVTNLNLALNSGGGITLLFTNAALGNFVPSASLAVGSSPYAVTVADVNGDGFPDLISANYSSSTLSVLTNNRSGVFRLASTLSVGSNPEAVLAADVNGDGHPDLITANQFGNTLTVLTNNGGGSFGLAASPAVGVNPCSVTAADVNGDGLVDLIAANQTSATLTVLTNNGSGGFGVSAIPAVASNPRSVITADVNGDGWPDLITANFNPGGTLTVLTNNGSGGFGLAASPAVGSNPNAVTTADVNGDGKPDLISANKSGSSLTVLTNNGSGSFGLAATLSVGSAPAAVAAADVNGDGKLDLVSANSGNGTGNTLTVLTNNGSGGFVLAATPVVGSNPNFVATADVNGDGSVDLISANLSANTLTVLLNNTLTFRGVFLGNGAGLTSLNAAQLTSGTVSDARLSRNVASGAAAANAATPANTPNTIVKRDGAGNFAAGTITGNLAGNATSATTALTAATATNLLGGVTDAQLSTNVALLNRSAQTFTGTNRFAGMVLATNGNNQFAGDGAGLTNLSATNLVGTLPVTQLSGTLSLAQLPATVVTNQPPGPVSGDGSALTNLNLTLNSGGAISLSGKFVLASSRNIFPSGTSENIAAFTVADFNEDGRLDLIAVAKDSSQFTVLTNNGHAGVGVREALFESGGSFPQGVTVADFVGDFGSEFGLLDLIIENNDNNNGPGLRVENFDYPLPDYTLNIAGGFLPHTLHNNNTIAADVNGDGKLDLIVCKADGSLLMLTNTGDIWFSPLFDLSRSISLAGHNLYPVTPADVNGDGKVDLITSDSVSKTLLILTNNGTGGFFFASSPGVSSNAVATGEFKVADVNGDGKPDLICPDHVTDTLTVFTNNGNGGFVPASAAAEAHNLLIAAVADMDEDGRLDLITQDYNQLNLLTVLTNNGSGGFGLDYTMDMGSHVYFVAATDFNGDGRPDLLICSYAPFSGNYQVSVWLNLPNFAGSFTGNGSGLNSVPASAITGGVTANILTSTNGGHTLFITNGIIMKVQ